MAATSVKQPFPIYTDVDGDPLENGYIYVGTINLDPVTNPITVYWDAALTLPAAQPVRTIGGYASNNGSPGALFASSDFSITIKDKNQTLVTTASTSTVEIGVATSTKVGGVLSGTDISVDAVGNVTVVNDSHTHDTQYYPQATVDSDVADRRKLYAKEPTTISPPSNGDYTITAAENLYGKFTLVDGSWAAAHNIIVDTSIRDFMVDNSAGTYNATVKTAAGTGITVKAGKFAFLYCDGTNVIYNESSVGTNQTWQDVSGSRALGVTYTNTTGKPIEICVSMVATGVISTLTVDGVLLSNIGTAGGTRSPHTATIPNGSQYVVALGTIETWTELR